MFSKYKALEAWEGSWMVLRCKFIDFCRLLWASVDVAKELSSKSFCSVTFSWRVMIVTGVPNFLFWDRRGVSLSSSEFYCCLLYVYSNPKSCDVRTQGSTGIIFYERFFEMLAVSSLLIYNARPCIEFTAPTALPDLAWLSNIFYFLEFIFESAALCGSLNPTAVLI